MRDSWAWVHGVHLFFAADALFNLLVLVALVYRNAKQGKIWVGDAFVSISSTLLPRAVLVLISWTVNNFWTLMEFCLREGTVASAVPAVVAVPEPIVYADLLAIYLGLAGLAGHVLRERIDPALVVLLFEIGFQNRQTIWRWFPSLFQFSSAFAWNDYQRGLAPMDADYASLTPMRFWTVHTLAPKDPKFIFASLWPTFASFVLVIIYAFARKVYVHFYPPRLTTVSHVTGGSTPTRNSIDSSSSLSWKSTLTVFEIATSAPLQNRVGLVSDYDNCVYIKGMKFASADGIYVIASSKWLIPTDHLLVVFVIVLTRVRFRDVYVYEVEGFNVQKTARLLYPQMLTVRELCRLNVSMLA